MFRWSVCEDRMTDLQPQVVAKFVPMVVEQTKVQDFKQGMWSSQVMVIP